MNAKSTQIAALNDEFRRTLKGGRKAMTPRLNKLSGDAISALWLLIKGFDDFQPANAAQSDHDFGAFTYEGVDFAWAIDASQCSQTRVITLMLASEYTARISGAPAHLEAARARRHMGAI